MLLLDNFFFKERLPWVSRMSNARCIPHYVTDGRTHCLRIRRSFLYWVMNANGAGVSICLGRAVPQQSYPTRAFHARQRTRLLPRLGHVSWRYRTRCWPSRSCTADTRAALTSKTDKQLQQCRALVAQHTCTVPRNSCSIFDTVHSVHFATTTHTDSSTQQDTNCTATWRCQGVTGQSPSGWRRNM